MKRPYRLTVLFGLSLLSACGGGGGSSVAPSIYTVGGSISGLGNSTGLVLLDNGGDALSVPASATSFTFGTTVANGSSYAVTVQTQPSGETCTVSSGSGSVNGANVTSVAVSCTANATYTVGGSISGLGNSTGLVLLDNGGDALSVPASATSFTFGTKVANGSSYAVTVQTQPSGETCTVSSGSGSVNGANVTSVAVSCTANATYTVGGSISGLTADSGVVLVDNGGNALTVPANATTFTFTSPLANGATYAVTVQTQPTGENCSVGGGTGPINAANVTSVAVTCSSNFAGSAANVIALSVNPGPASSGSQTFNIPLATVKVCQGATCATIPNVLVDTGSSGLRLMASVLTAAGLTPTPETSTGHTLYECMPYADGYTWGEVAGGTAATLTVTLGQETTTTSVPIQVIDDDDSQPQAPTGCSNFGASMDGVDLLDANGVLGVGVADQDCGSTCETSRERGLYVCPGATAGNPCSSPANVAVAANEQVSNPVASLPTDNNGVIVQLPAIPSTGAATANGYLVLGIGTESNNALSGVTVYTTSSAGDFTTVFNGQSLTESFVDSGSNALYFNDSSLATCGTTMPLSDFYCPANSPPASPIKSTASPQGNNGTSSQITFQVVDLTSPSLDTSNFALDDVAGLATGTQLTSNYFDWGVPFFYGRTVYVAIDGKTAGSATGPYDAF